MKKFFANLGVIVDLSVENELNGVVGVRHGLVGALREIDDSQAAESKTDFLVR